MSQALREILNKILNWVKDVLPTAMTVFMTVYNHMMSKIIKIENEKEAVELEKKYLENQIKVENDLKGKSDHDIIMDAVSDGSRVRSDSE